MLSFQQNSPVLTLIRPDCFVEKLTVWTREREPFKRSLPSTTSANLLRHKSYKIGKLMEWCILVVVHTYILRTYPVPCSSCVCWYGMCIDVRRYSRTTVYQYCVYVAFLCISILYFSSSSGMFYFVSYSASSNR